MDLKMPEECDTAYPRIAKKLVTGRTGSVAPSAFN